MSALLESPEHWQNSLYLQFYHHENHIRQKHRHAHHVRREWTDVNECCAHLCCHTLTSLVMQLLFNQSTHFYVVILIQQYFCTILIWNYCNNCPWLWSEQAAKLTVGGQSAGFIQEKATSSMCTPHEGCNQCSTRVAKWSVPIGQKGGW